MPDLKKKRKITPRQELGMRLALKLGLPTTCPLWCVVDGEEACKETQDYCHNPNLDAESNIDYRLCDIFSQWFWRQVKEEELGLAPHAPTKQSPENSKEGKENE